jgi:uncharacterized protein YjbI with pentapeptide repeats
MGGAMPKDFSHQDLRGKSFKGQDLTGADFSHATFYPITNAAENSGTGI